MRYKLHPYTKLLVLCDEAWLKDDMLWMLSVWNDDEEGKLGLNWWLNNNIMVTFVIDDQHCCNLTLIKVLFVNKIP